MAKRGRNIVIKSQFNINGSRGKSVKSFITNYVSRESATKPLLGHLSDDGVVEVGDGNCFTFTKSSIKRDEVLKIADKVEDKFLNNKQAIQQMVVSFDHDFLVENNVVDKDLQVLRRGDYENGYDELKLRHAIRRGVREIADRDGYYSPEMIATIQHDTNHLHSHVVLYENEDKLGRKHKNEERGVIKSKSFAYGALEMERSLDKQKNVNVTRNKLLIEEDRDTRVSTHDDVDISTELDIMTEYLNLLYLEELRKEKEQEGDSFGFEL